MKTYRVGIWDGDGGFSFPTEYKVVYYSTDDEEKLRKKLIKKYPEPEFCINEHFGKKDIARDFFLISAGGGVTYQEIKIKVL